MAKIRSVEFDIDPAMDILEKVGLDATTVDNALGRDHSTLVDELNKLASTKAEKDAVSKAIAHLSGADGRYQDRRKVRRANRRSL